MPILKRSGIFFICCTLILSATAQQRSKPIAPFIITLANGQSYKYTQLVKGKPVILIYFSPDCDHCVNFTKAMINRMQQLKDRQIVMVTYLPLADVKTFYAQYKLAAYPNIKIGTEGYKFIVRKYYQVQLFPYIVVYDKQGKLVKTISDQNMKPEVMAAEL